MILNKKLYYYIFFFGVLLFIFYKAGFVFYSTTMRSQPVEVDDSYVYIWKAVIMTDCFHDCPAQVDLRKQLFLPAQEKKTESVRRRTAGELFVVMTPLHSMILYLLHKIGLDWVNSLRTVVLVGVIFICLAIAYWLFITWGPLAAGVSLIFISPMIFQAQGLQTIVPSNITLGIGVLMWGRINHAIHKTWLALPFLSIAAVMMHPIGIVYSTVALGSYILTVGRKMSRKNLVCILFTLGILTCAFLLPQYIDRPMMDYNGFTTFQNKGWIEGVKSNINTVFGSFGSRRVIKSMNIVIIGLGGFLLSLKLLDKKNRRRIITLGILLGLLCLISFLYVLPGYPADFFYRIWIPTITFFLAACAHFLCSAIELLQKRQKRADRILTNKIPLNKIFFSVLFNWRKILTFILGFVLLGALVWQLISSTPRFVRALESRIKRHPFTLDKQQPAELLKRASHGDKVLYTDEIPLLFHLVNGSHKLGAVYYPAIQNTSIEQHWMKEISYIVSWNNPFRMLTAEGERYPPVLRLSDIKTITCESDETEKIEKLEVMIENPGQTFNIEVIVRSSELGGNSEKSFLTQVPAGFEGWLPLSPKRSDVATNWFQLTPTKVNNKAILHGLHFSDGNSLTVWPWKQQARITVHYKEDKTISARFDVTKNLVSDELKSYFENNPESLSIIMDTGSMIIMHKEKLIKNH